MMDTGANDTLRLLHRYIALASLGSGIALVSLCITLLATINMPRLPLLSIMIQLLGLAMTLWGTSLAFPLYHSDKRIQYIQGYLYPTIAVIGSWVFIVTQILHHPNIWIRYIAQMSTLLVCLVMAMVMGHYIRRKIAMHFVNVPNQFRMIDRARQVLTVSAVISGLILWTSLTISV